MASGLFPNVNDLEKAASSFYKRLLIAEQYSLNHNIQSPVHLLKAEDSKLQSTDSDYGLSQVNHFFKHNFNIRYISTYSFAHILSY